FSHILNPDDSSEYLVSTFQLGPLVQAVYRSYKDCISPVEPISLLVRFLRDLLIFLLPICIHRISRDKSLPTDSKQSYDRPPILLFGLRLSGFQPNTFLLYIAG